MAAHASLAAALIGFTLVLLAAAGCGMALLRALRADTDSPAEQLVMGSALGLGLLAYAVLAAGLLGYLRPPILLLLVLIEAAIGARALATWARELVDRIHHGDTGGRSEGATGRGSEPADTPATAPLSLTSSVPPSPRRPVAPSSLRASVVKHFPRFAATALVLFCLYLVGSTLVGALAPPNGDDWDSLAYHLAAPKIYLAHGKIAFIPYDSHTDFPFSMEMLYAIGLAYGGAAGAKLFHWAAGWLTALGIAAFCRRLFPVRDGDVAMPVWAPPLAAALFFSIPQVQWQATTAYIDLGATLYQFLGLVSFVYAVTDEKSGVQVFRCSGVRADEGEPVSDFAGPEHLNTRTPEHLNTVSSARGWLIVSGLMSGWAMGTKMTALLPFGLLVLAAAGWAAFGGEGARDGQGEGATGRRGEAAMPAASASLSLTLPPRPVPPSPRPPLAHSHRWRGAALLALAGVLVACPWYIKSYLWTHNPVYPFFYKLFPHSVQWTSEADAAYRHEQGFFGLGHGLKALLMTPWNLAMQGWAYFNVPSRLSPPGTLPYFDGLRRGGLSASFLGLVPLALFTRRWDRRLTGLVGYALALLLPWFVLSQQSRYLLPVVAPLAVVAAAVVANLEVDLHRWAAGAFVVLVLFLHGVWGREQILLRAFPVVSEQVSREAYLQRSFPPYEAQQYINTLPTGSKVALYQETRGFYLDRDYLWANPLQNTLIPYERFSRGSELVEFLRERLGVTHVLINTAGLPGSENTRWYRLLKDAIDHGDLIPVFAAHGVNVYATGSAAHG